jgi:beta-glucosidase
LNIERNIWIAILIIFVYLNTSCRSRKEVKLDFQDAQNLEYLIDSLLSIMTLEEKIGQMTQVRHFEDIEGEDIKNKKIGSVIHTEGPVPGNAAIDWQNKFNHLQKQALSTRLGIPLLFGVDAVHGQNTFNGATIFPHNIGLGATANSDLVEEVSRITSIEAKATGFNWVFSPCIAIPFNEKWGRFYEAYSESTQISSKLARAAVKGLQVIHPDHTRLMATAKHFIADGATDNGKEGGTASICDTEISQSLLPPYKAAIEEGVGAIMISFNTVNDIKMHMQKVWITDTLKNALGFDGIVVSDWKAYSRFGEENIINAGIDMVMAVDGDLDYFQADLRSAVKNGLVSEERIDDAVRRILRQKFKLGLFKNPLPKDQSISKIGCFEHRSIARQAVRESLVLLKNKDQILPLEMDQKIVVVGEHANNTGLQSGGWTIHWQGTSQNYRGSTSLLDGLRDLSKEEILYDSTGTADYDADVAIVVVGETPYAEFFGDIHDGPRGYKLELTEKHKKYIQSYKRKGMRIVTVLISGRPLVVTKEIEISDAFVAAWLPGSEGLGIAEVLFGKYNFKGKLPHSWPKSTDDFDGLYGPNFWDDSIMPLFQIGYGLNYETLNNSVVD